MKKIIIFVLAITVCLSACGMNISEQMDATINDNDYNSNILDYEEEEEMEFATIDNKEIIQNDAWISDKLITIPYLGNLYIRSIVTTGDLIFLSGVESKGGNYVIHKMKIEENVSERLPLDIPENMTVQGINVDRAGNLHIFFTDSDRSVKRCEMWVSDQDGNVIRKIDMKKAFEEEGSYLTEFVIDEEGRYFISGSRKKEGESGITVLDAEGNILGMVDSPKVALWLLQAIACGKDGDIYAIGHTKGLDVAFMSINPDDLCLEEYYEEVLPANNGKFLRVRAGIDADIYIYGPAGIYSYNVGDEIGKQLIDGSSFLFNTEGGTCYDFLSDGRFLFVEGDHLMYSGEIGGNQVWYSGEMYQNIMFYYLPVARSPERE